MLVFDTEPLPGLVPGNVDTLPTHGYGRFTQDIFVRPCPSYRNVQHMHTPTWNANHPYIVHVLPCTFIDHYIHPTKSRTLQLLLALALALLNSFTMDITPDTNFNEHVKVASGNALAWYDLASRYTPLTKWQMNALQKNFKGGGDTLLVHAGIADMFTALCLHDGNAIWRNDSNNYNAAAGRHVDDSRFKRSATYIFHFGPACLMQWDGKDHELLHNILYGFSGSMQHELPCCGRYSLSLRACV